MAPMLATLRREAEAYSQGRHAIEVHDQAGCDLLGSTQELHSAFSNLVTNAIRYTPAGGRVRVDFARTPEGGAVLSVRDTGYGISQAVIDGVAAGRVESRSIGLMNVHQRVKLLYGDGLHLKRLEPGTEVCFYLPDQEAMPC